MEKQSFFKRIGLFRKDSARDQQTPLAGASAEKFPEDPKDPRVRIQNLEMDIRDRDAKIEAMKKEFELLTHQAASHAQNAGNNSLLKLAKRVAPLLSQVDTMQYIHQDGEAVKIQDLFKLFSKMAAIFSDMGLVPLGIVGETAPFDPKIHQRMSGGDVTGGTPVKVRFTGYCFGETILAKAMVSREE